MPRKSKHHGKKATPVKNSIENQVEKILQSMNVSYVPQATIDKYTVDFLINEKYIVECYGDYWHCNPHQYTSSYFNRGKKKTAEEIWNRDYERKMYLEQKGYKFLCVWENEIRNNLKIVKSKIKRNIKLDIPKGE